MEENIKEDLSKQSGEIIKESKSKLDINNSLLFIIAVLVVMSGVQVFQMQGILKAISSGSIKTNTQTQGGTIGLPSQVGGCG